VFDFLSKERVFISVQGSEATVDEWNALIEGMRNVRSVPDLRYLVRVEGSPPSPVFQARIADVVRGQKCRVALMSSSAAMRFVVSTFSLVNKTIRYFSPDQLREALAHLGCTPLEQVAVQEAFDRLTLASSQSRS